MTAGRACSYTWYCFEAKSSRRSYQYICRRVKYARLRHGAAAKSTCSSSETNPYSDPAANTRHRKACASRLVRAIDAWYLESSEHVSGRSSSTEYDSSELLSCVRLLQLEESSQKQRLPNDAHDMEYAIQQLERSVAGEQKLHRLLEPCTLEDLDVEGSTTAGCDLLGTSLSKVYNFKDARVSELFVRLFHAAASSAPSQGLQPLQLSRYDLFHGYACSLLIRALPYSFHIKGRSPRLWLLAFRHIISFYESLEIGVLLHAREYPAESEEFPINLGYCQTGACLRHMMRQRVA